MDSVQVIDVVDAPNKWLRLMLHFQNSAKNASFRCSFPDKETAAKVRQRMNDVIGRRPTWFTLIVAQRGSDVYVINGSRAKNVEVRYD